MRIPNGKRLKSFIWLLIVGLVAVNSSCAIVFILQCRPMSGLWDPSVKAHCWSAHVYLVWGYFQGGTTALTYVVWERMLIPSVSSLFRDYRLYLLEPSGCSLMECTHFSANKDRNLRVDGDGSTVRTFRSQKKAKPS